MQYTAHGERLTGIAIPLGAARTRDGWRVGEYPDLAVLGALCTAVGARLLQLLPVNDTGGQSSPYSALSAFALHPLYLRVRDLPEADACPEALGALDRFAKLAKRKERFPYGAALEAKLSALRAVYRASEKAIAADPALASFVADNPWVKTYAVFKRLKSENGERPWRDWKAYRDPSPAEVEALWADRKAASEQRFHAWVQMRCAEQFGSAAKALAASGIQLLGDLPILMNEDSADVWANRGWFDLGMRAGAPPDMFAALGQNWGFPVYDWDAMERDGYAFWKARVREADKYYSAFRIDHVLGFFRIWSLPEREESGYLGRFVPGQAVGRSELHAVGFSDERLRWLSEPHVRGADLAASSATGAIPAAALEALSRIDGQDLYLFGRNVRGERDIAALDVDPGTRAFLLERWRDRVLVPSGRDAFVPAWTRTRTTAWPTLSDAERAVLEGLFQEARAVEEADWAVRGRRLLGMLAEASGMLPCAEDLGAVPACVPAVLEELGIPGLRIPRWTRDWDLPGQPFVRLDRYPKLSVCTPSVHDTSTLRGWWDLEDGREAFARAYCPALDPAPAALDPASELRVLESLAGAASVLYVLQLQDLLDLSAGYRSADPRADRVNVPGAVDDFNWTWRMGPAIEDLLEAEAWTKRARAVAAAR